jgi:hypothetical protein
LSGAGYLKRQRFIAGAVPSSSFDRNAATPVGAPTTISVPVFETLSTLQSLFR